MENSQCFQRIEQKYVLHRQVYHQLRQQLENRMIPDQYGVCHISSVYFDTVDHRMVRQSLEKLRYKEKLRLRAYGLPMPDRPAFVELKKKCGGIVYKRRVEMQLAEAENYLYHGGHPKAEILREVDYLRQFYGELRPAAWIGYARIALAGLEDPALRITFDWDLRWRNEDMYLNDNQTGRRLLPEQQHLMEIKVPGAMPLWLVHILGQLEIYPVSFSKYGTAYQQSVALGAVNREADILLPNGVKKGMMICA